MTLAHTNLEKFHTLSLKIPVHFGPKEHLNQSDSYHTSYKANYRNTDILKSEVGNLLESGGQTAMQILGGGP